MDTMMRRTYLWIHRYMFWVKGVTLRDLKVKGLRAGLKGLRA
jgi:hypothetical protein